MYEIRALWFRHGIPSIARHCDRPNVRYLTTGNHGALQFEDSPGADGLKVELSPIDDRAASEAASFIEESLRQGRAVRPV